MFWSSFLTVLNCFVAALFRRAYIAALSWKTSRLALLFVIWCVWFELIRSTFLVTRAALPESAIRFPFSKLPDPPPGTRSVRPLPRRICCFWLHDCPVSFVFLTGDTASGGKENGEPKCEGCASFVLASRILLFRLLGERICDSWTFFRLLRA